MFKQDFNSRQRHEARLSAVQALYQMELSGQGSKLVIQEFSEHWFLESAPLNPETSEKPYFEMLVSGVVSHQPDIDGEIRNALAENWRLSRLDTTLRAIMRCAVYELLYCVEVPAIVILSEYVKIAEDFYSGSEPKFVNGALDKIARKTRTTEFGIPNAG